MLVGAAFYNEISNIGRYLLSTPTERRKNDEPPYNSCKRTHD